MEKLIITVGITGSHISRKQTPYIPILPGEIAQPDRKRIRTRDRNPFRGSRDSGSGFGENRTLRSRRFGLMTIRPLGGRKEVGRSEMRVQRRALFEKREGDLKGGKP